MRTERARVAAVLAVLLIAAACNRGGGPAATPEGCGVPTPEPGVRPELVPAELLLDGDAGVSAAKPRKGGVTAVLSVDMSVQDALPVYKKAVDRAGFEIVGEDNEGFEAELYLKKGERLGAIQIRRTLCDDVSIVFVNIVKGNYGMPIVTTPAPSPT